MKMFAVSLVPFNECHKCDTCDAQYQLNADHSSVALPFRYYVKNATSTGYSAVQDITFYAVWQSCGLLQDNSLTFTSHTTVHKTGNVEFPFHAGNKSHTFDTGDDDGSGTANGMEYVSAYGFVPDAGNGTTPSDDDDGYYSYYGDLNPTNLSAHKNNGMSITLSSNIGAGSAAYLNYSNSLAVNMSSIPTAGGTMCFNLVCGVLDHFVDKASTQSSSAVEVLSTSDSPYVQMQGVLAQTSDTVTGTCTATVYGNPMPFFFVSNGVTQSPSYLCTAKSTLAQITSLSFANLLIAFGVMNFAAKASNRISKVGYYRFATSCGAEVLDI